MSLSKLTGSALSIVQENAFSLSSIRLDVSLVKVEAPPEYAALGPALSRKRRDSAEDGTSHRTARRLGALFEQLIPSTPTLMKMYGKRCTKIMRTPGINPTESESHYGPFNSYVGADGTALWASATSGIASLGVYLLACILADCWGTKEAISIWVELVSARKKEIELGARSGDLVSATSMQSAQEVITRSDLSMWDASARAWMQSADQAMYREKTQLVLIMKNTLVPFEEGLSVYQHVIEIWQRAMKGMEELLLGRPQRVTSIFLLLASSAWHIYPDLIVLGADTKNVRFKDALVPDTGVCTIGTWRSSTSTELQESRWSLTLSHLRYYGGPVNVTSEGNKSHVAFRKFHLVVLGGMFGAWRIRKADIYEAAHWLHSTWLLLETGLRDLPSAHLDGLSWLKNLSRACEDLLSSRGIQENANEFLVAFGQRRAKEFLGKAMTSSTPFFGLRNKCVLAALSMKLDRECNITFHRTLASELKIEERQGLICSRWIVESTSGALRYQVYEMCTAVPHTTFSAKRDGSGDRVTMKQHARWLHFLHIDDQPLGERDLEQIREPTGLLYDLVHSWQEKAHKLGEIAFQVLNGPEFRDGMIWTNPPSLFLPRQASYGGSCRNVACECFKLSKADGKVSFSSIVSFSGLVTASCVTRLYISKLGMHPAENDDVERNYMARIARANSDTIEFGSQQKIKLHPARLHDYLCCIFTPSAKTDGNDFQRSILEPLSNVLWMDNIAQFYRVDDSIATSLKALGVASTIYDTLKDATIPLSVAQRPFCTTHWYRYASASDFGNGVARSFNNNDELPILMMTAPRRLSRGCAFSCIIYFESGDFDLNPEALSSVLAVCANNSLYVSELLLSDPYSRVPSGSVRRIIGNIGKSGICLLIAPEKPRIKTPTNEYDVVSHAPFDGRRENNFRGTSMHLSLTDWTAPVIGIESRTIDQGVQYVECVISLIDAGSWIADLDILGIKSHKIMRLKPSKHLGCSHPPKGYKDYTSIDGWEEFLDKPDTIGLVRATDNWVARLAALSLFFQLGYDEQGVRVGIWGPDEYCISCLEDDFEQEEGYSAPGFKSHLPSVCIT